MKRTKTGQWAAVLRVSITLALTSCARTVLPPAPTAVIETLTIKTLPTLPPTWTPAPTLTAPPTDTPYPTITPPPTFTAEQLCQNFHLIAAPAANASIAYDGVASFTWTGLNADATLTLQLTVHGAKAGVRADVVTPGDGVVAVPMLRLPQEGPYDWQLWLQSVSHPEYGQLCIHTGTLVRQPVVMM